MIKQLALQQCIPPYTYKTTYQRLTVSSWIEQQLLTVAWYPMSAMRLTALPMECPKTGIKYIQTLFNLSEGGMFNPFRWLHLSSRQVCMRNYVCVCYALATINRWWMKTLLLISASGCLSVAPAWMEKRVLWYQFKIGKTLPKFQLNASGWLLSWRWNVSIFPILSRYQRTISTFMQEQTERQPLWVYLCKCYVSRTQKLVWKHEKSLHQRVWCSKLQPEVSRWSHTYHLEIKPPVKTREGWSFRVEELGLPASEHTRDIPKKHDLSYQFCLMMTEPCSWNVSKSFPILGWYQWTLFYNLSKPKGVGTPKGTKRIWGSYPSPSSGQLANMIY